MGVDRYQPITENEEKIGKQTYSQEQIVAMSRDWYSANVEIFISEGNLQ